MTLFPSDESREVLGKAAVASCPWVLFIVSSRITTKEDLPRLCSVVANLGSSKPGAFFGGREVVPHVELLRLADYLILNHILGEIHPDWSDELAEIQDHLEWLKDRFVNELWRQDFDTYVNDGIHYCTKSTDRQKPDRGLILIQTPKQNSDSKVLLKMIAFDPRQNRC
jgi:hypothetical protein